MEEDEQKKKNVVAGRRAMGHVQEETKLENRVFWIRKLSCFRCFLAAVEDDVT